MEFSKPLVVALSAAAFTFTACKDENNNNNPTDKSSEVYVSSNSSGRITMAHYDGESEAQTETYETPYQSGGGVYYDAEADILYQNDRSNNQLVAYSNFSSKADGASLVVSFGNDLNGTIFQNGRDISKDGNYVVVAQEADAVNSNVNAFFVYEVENNQKFSFKSLYLSSEALWGIHLEGNTLYAIEDGSGHLMVYNNFIADSIGLIEPDVKVEIEGIVQIKGVKYDAPADVMVLTGIGSANSDSDGSVHLITGFSGKLNAAGNNGTIGLSDQIVIEGSSTLLGNPVDVDYHADSKTIFVAESTNGGGQLLIYNNVTAGGNITPSYNQSVAGASSVYAHKK